MAKKDLTKGRILWTPPTVSPSSEEAKNVEVGKTVRDITPKSIGDIVNRQGVLWRVVAVHPIEYRKKYGKEYSYAHKEIVQTYSIWTGDYRYTLQEIVYDPDWKFNVGEACTFQNEVGIVRERHGLSCPWYKVEFEDKIKVLYEEALSKIEGHLTHLQFYKDSLASLAMERGMALSAGEHWRTEIKKECSSHFWNGLILGFLLAVVTTILLL